MANSTNKPQDPRQLLAQMDEEHFYKIRKRSALGHYGNYLDKILEVTGGKVIYDYEEFNKRE